MTISFAIPAHNEENTIGRCLAAVVRDARACGHQVEIIVVDNASTDGTAAVAAAVPGVRVVREPRKGLGHARQAGFLASRGELLACIDADSILTPGWIRRTTRAFERSPRLAALSGPYRYQDLSSFTQLFVVLWYIAAAIVMSYIGQYVLRRSAMLQGGNYVVRRRCLERIGGYNTDVVFYGEDIDLATRLRQIGEVRFSFRLPILTSGRRLRREGVFATAVKYMANGLWVMARGKPLSNRYTDVRED